MITPDIETMRRWTLSPTGIKRLLVSVNEFIRYKTEKFESTSAMDFGNIYELFLFGKEEFKKDVLVSDLNKNTTEFKKLKAAGKYKYFIDSALLEKMKTMEKFFYSNESIYNLLSQKTIKIEYQKEFFYEMFGYTFHGFMDLVLHTEKYLYINDLKTLSPDTTTEYKLNKWYEDANNDIQEFIYKEYYRTTQKKPVVFRFLLQNTKTFKPDYITTNNMYDKKALERIGKAVSRWDKFLKNPNVYRFGSCKPRVTEPSRWYLENEVSEEISEYIPEPVPVLNIEPKLEKKPIAEPIPEPKKEVKPEPAKPEPLPIQFGIKLDEPEAETDVLKILQKQDYPFAKEMMSKITAKAKLVWPDDDPKKVSQYILIMYDKAYKQYGEDDRRVVDGSVLNQLDNLLGN